MHGQDTANAAHIASIPVLGNQIKQLLLGQIPENIHKSAQCFQAQGIGSNTPGHAVEHIQPMVGHSTDMRIALLQRASFQKLPKDLRLENLDELQLAAPLKLKPLSGQELLARLPGTTPYVGLP